MKIAGVTVRQTHFDAATVTMAYSANAHGDLKDQLRKCWKRDYDWTLLPAHVQNVSFVATNYDKQVFLSFLCSS